MSTTLRHADSISGKLLRGPVKAPMLMWALGTAAALHAQSGDQSAKQPQAGTYSLLYSFQCSPDAENPQGGLARDSTRNLYGTTFYGGQYGGGTVFKVTSGGTESVLHSFGDSPSDGSEPEYGSLTLDAAGNVYGTTAYGGEFGYGTVFKVTAAGREGVLYNFTGGLDGANPQGGMARDSAGNLYGTAYKGGTYGYGVVFEVTPGGTESVLYNFGSSQTDGEYPSDNLTRDASGNLYGATQLGGAVSVGTVFEVAASGVDSVLFSFDYDDGTQPFDGGLLRDTSGNLYGVAGGGTGGYGGGVVFELTPGGTETVLFNFTGFDGGKYPYNPDGSLARDCGW